VVLPFGPIRAAALPSRFADPLPILG